MLSRTRAAVAIASALAVAATVAPIVGADADETASSGYSATIRRTHNGIPHITADSHADVAFGFGYAFAEDNLCTAADFYVTVNGQRSKHFGPNGTWRMRGNGSNNTNLDSDFFYTRINDSGIIEDLLSQPYPHGPADGVRDGVKGYVAGFNRFLADYQADAADGTFDEFAPHPCGDEAWVRPITEQDAYRRFFQLAALASAGVAIDEIGSAQPPHPDAPLPDVSALEAAQQAPELGSRLSEAIGIGSNAYGLGGDATYNGQGMVLGNPHFPWHEGERLYQSHMTVIDDGETIMDVAGASLYGVPLILIGHTDGLAWSHTVSTAYRFTPFEITLVPGQPTKYLVDGEARDMVARNVTVEIDDQGNTATRTLYETHLGPMMNGILGLPIFPWTPTRAFALGDANVHMRYLNHFWEVNHAQTVEDMYRIQSEIQGIPWVNTMAADSKGDAYYGDVSVVPNVSDDKATVCNTEVGHALTAYLGLPVLDGSRSACEWDTDADAVAPGIFGPSNLPHLFRRDYVSNSNDSHWLSNPHEPLEGFASIIGPERTERTLRTRIGLAMVEDELAAANSQADLFTRQEVQDLVFNNRQHAGELTVDAVVAMCREMAGVYPSSDGPPELDPTGEACDALAGWGRTDDLDDPGAILFRRFWTHARAAAGSAWLTPFDVNDPINTPRDLNTAHPEVRAALGDAVSDLRGAGIPLDAPLRGWQYEIRGPGSAPIPIHGGPGALGVFNAINVGWHPSKGFPDVDHGSSFVMVASFADPQVAGCHVDASAIVTYSQSENPASPHFDDQTLMYSNKIWNGMHFCEHEVAANTISTRVVTS